MYAGRNPTLALRGNYFDRLSSLPAKVGMKPVRNGVWSRSPDQPCGRCSVSPVGFD